jgi:hypothetical protein
MKSHHPFTNFQILQSECPFQGGFRVRLRENSNPDPGITGSENSDQVRRREDQGRDVRALVIERAEHIRDLDLRKHSVPIIQSVMTSTVIQMQERKAIPCKVKVKS